MKGRLRCCVRKPRQLTQMTLANSEVLDSPRRILVSLARDRIEGSNTSQVRLNDCLERPGPAETWLNATF